MSGGAFDFRQYEIENLADEIQSILERDDNIPEIAKDAMREAVKALRIAFAHVHSLDWYLSGDIDSEGLVIRLRSLLKGLEK